MSIPSVVYDIAEAYSSAKNRTAEQIYRIMTNKISLVLLKDNVLPKLVAAKILSSRVAGEGTPGEVTIYTWLGLDNADHRVLDTINVSSALYSGLGATINSGGSSK